MSVVDSDISFFWFQQASSRYITLSTQWLEFNTSVGLMPSAYKSKGPWKGEKEKGSLEVWKEKHGADYCLTSLPNFEHYMQPSRSNRRVSTPAES